MCPISTKSIYCRPGITKFTEVKNVSFRIDINHFVNNSCRCLVTYSYAKRPLAVGQQCLAAMELLYRVTLLEPSCWWLGGVVVRALDLRSKGCWFDSWLMHCRATTLGKLFTPMCLCSPSSIIWYLARAFMLMRLYVAAIHGSNEQGEYCRSGSAVISRLLRTAI